MTGRQNSQEQATFAFELWERIRREFPELRIHKVWDRPVGPHPIAMFEMDVLTPKQFGALIPWLVIHRGSLSVLIHANTCDDERDHTQVSLSDNVRLSVRDLTKISWLRGWEKS